MFSKFKEGIAFGAGFGLSFVIVVYLFSFAFTSLWALANSGSTVVSMGNEFEPGGSRMLTEDEITELGLDDYEDDSVEFHNLPLDERVERASFIAVAKFEDADDGRRVAILTEILKQKGRSYSRYKVGDEWNDASYMPGFNAWKMDADEVLIMRDKSGSGVTSPIREGRIRSLGDISVEMLKQMCKDDT